MKTLGNLSDAQLVEIGIVSMREYLTFFSEDRPWSLVELFLSRWKADQFAVVGVNLIAEDITLLNFMRGRAFRNFIPRFTQDPATIIELIDELDSFFVGSTTASFDTCFSILQERISKHEKALLEAQKIAGIGSFEWDLVTNKTIKSPETDRIFEIGEQGFDAFIKHVYPPHRIKVEKAMARSLIDGKYECEFSFQNKGPLKNIRVKGAITFDGEKPVKFIGIVQDITESKKAEQEILEKRIALERSNESLQQFAFVASHDLQEPIRQISTFADIVLSNEQAISESSRNSLAKVVKQAIRMRQMIDDILSYSTLTQWEGREDFDMNEVLKNALENLEQKIEEKKACIEFYDLPTMHAVPSQVQQLLQNLISNALKFAKPGIPPKIDITHSWCHQCNINPDQVNIAEKYLKLEIKDNGIGFDQQFSNKIFGLFSRLHNKKDYQGSGIGLAIAKKIVDNHGGMISASSVKGEGATFTIVLPQ